MIQLVDNEPSTTVLGTPRDDTISTSVTLSCDLVQPLQRTYTIPVVWSWSRGDETVISTNSRYQIQSNDTSSSLLIRNLRYSDSASYLCSVYYSDKYNTSLQTRQQNLNLTGE